jgi:hypothetical protein
VIDARSFKNGISSAGAKGVKGAFVKQLAMMCHKAMDPPVGVSSAAEGLNDLRQVGED